MTWPAKPVMTTRQRRARRYAIVSFVLGVVSVALHFLTQGPTPNGVGPVLFLIIFPALFGIVGIVCGAMSQRYVWVVLNSLVLLSFPLMMFFGTLMFGP